MRKNIFPLVVLFCVIVFGNDVYSATKKRGRVSKNRSAVKSVSGKLSSNTFTGSVKNITVENSVDDNIMSCGVPAVATNNQAKRLCAIAMADALKTYCKNYSCQSKLKVELSFNFGISSLSDISVDVGGVKCSGEKLNKFCTAYQSELLDGLWDLYSESNVRERKNCDMAMAKYSVAQDCFQYILAEKNQSVGGIFNSEKISNLDSEIDKRCGRDAILAKYKSRSIDDLTDDDMGKYFGSGKINSDGTLSFDGEAYQGKKKLSSTVASLFANVGDNTWNVMGQVGKLMDLKLNMKSSTYPRELVVIANTFVTDIETSCGKNVADSMQDTSFDLVDNRSALELAVAKKGLLKGAYDMIANEDWKKKGIVGKVKEKIEENKAKKTDKDVYPDAENDFAKLSSCSGNDEVTDMVQGILRNISKALNEIRGTDEKYRDILYKNNSEKIVKNVNQILTYSRFGDGLGEINSLSSDKFDTVDDVVKKLSDKSVKFKCPGVKFIDDKPVKFDFSFSNENIDAIAEALLNSKELFMKETADFTSMDNKDTFKGYRNTIEKMGETKSEVSKK